MINLKRKIYSLVEVVSYDDLKTPKIDPFDIFIIVLIALNMLAVILETVDPVYQAAPRIFGYFEIFSVIIFTIEYILRVWSCTINEKYNHPITGRIKFILSPLALIDLFAFLPFYIPMVIPADLRFLRGIRLLRLIRVLKFGRYSEVVRLFGRVFKAKTAELFTAIFLIFVLLIISSSILYYVERDAQPDKFSSIPQAMWWGVVTLTTVGYGDIFPITSMGKFLASVISLLGIGLFALPTGILSAGFVEEIKKKGSHIRCPHCGKEIYQ